MFGAWVAVSVAGWFPSLAGPWQVSPSPTPELLELDEADFDQLLERYGVNPENLPLWSLKGWYLISFIVAVAVTVLLLRAIYRGMQRPRLELEYHPTRPPSTTRRDVMRYAVTPLLLVPIWFFAVLAVLLLAANRGQGFRPPEELVIAAAVVVGGSRLLAHVNLEGAHELAKSVPLTLLSLILISGQTISLEAATVAITLLVVNFDSLSYYVLLLAFWDVVFTFGWLVMRRARWRRAQRTSNEAKPTWIREVWDSIREAWGGDDFGPSEAVPTTYVAPSTADGGTVDAGIRRMMLLPDPAPASAPASAPPAADVAGDESGPTRREDSE
ncbi:MAG: hypothetical protein H6525_04675 [Actinobacteria bacterium]|nr:hypothetical protein [Actinomycetota bacterium]